MLILEEKISDSYKYQDSLIFKFTVSFGIYTAQLDTTIVSVYEA